MSNADTVQVALDGVWTVVGKRIPLGTVLRFPLAGAESDPEMAGWGFAYRHDEHAGAITTFLGACIATSPLYDNGEPNPNFGVDERYLEAAVRHVAAENARARIDGSVVHLSDGRRAILQPFEPML